VANGLAAARGRFSQKLAFSGLFSPAGIGTPVALSLSGSVVADAKGP
jgi:hypothetical protein